MPPAERPCGRTEDGVEAQQLGVARDEDELRAVGGGSGADDRGRRP